MTGLAIMLNYVDRGAVSIAAPLIKDEMQLSATGYGLVVSAFFWTYVPALLLAGWLADRISVHRLMAGGVGLWALATFCTGFAGGLASLVALRLAMGVGEGVAFPSASKLMARAPDGRRATVNIALSGGLAMGPLVGTLAGGAILHVADWRTMFIVFGLVTLLWLLPWARLRGEVDAPAAATAEAAVAYPRLLATPALWAMSVFHFAGTYALYFIIAWLPLYLVKVRGYGIGDMALLTAFFYLFQTIGTAVSAGWIDRLIAAGRDAPGVRRAFAIGGFVISAVGVLAVPMTTSTIMLMAVLVPTSLCFGCNTGILFTAGQTLAGAQSAGRWIGVQSAVGNLAGIIGPVITGVIVDRAGYAPAFALTAAVTMLGLVAFLVGVRRVERLAWP
jgi:ACS family D-galactonate transporter-like MFS transporter